MREHNSKSRKYVKKHGMSHCPICNTSYFMKDFFFIKKNGQKKKLSGNNHPNRPSVDHILPLCRYTEDFEILEKRKEINNKQYMCASCNQGRARFNHCLPAFILAMDRDKRDGFKKIKMS